MACCGRGRGRVSPLEDPGLYRNPTRRRQEGDETAISTGKAKALRKLEVTQERVLREAARVAFSSVQDLVGADGELLPITEWPPLQEEIVVVENWHRELLERVPIP